MGLDSDRCELDAYCEISTLFFKNLTTDKCGRLEWVRRHGVGKSTLCCKRNHKCSLEV